MDVWLVHVHKPSGDIDAAHILQFDDDDWTLIEQTANEFGWRLSHADGKEPGGMQRWEVTDAQDRVRMSAERTEIKTTPITMRDHGIIFED
jgi:hypothetical protein